VGVSRSVGESLLSEAARDGVGLDDDESEPDDPSSAIATAELLAIASPIPRATASPPTRPT
jgi:hypothetical protein